MDERAEWTEGAETAPAAPASLDDQAHLSSGDKIGRFALLDELGRGGMGVVWSAYDPKLDRKVALKLLRSGRGLSTPGSGSRARLEREAKVMANLRHPNIVTVFESGEHDGDFYVVMEYVAGGTLRDYADRRRDRADGWKAIVAAYVQAGRGLIAAHERGLVHRDFKPANVLVEGERVQVTDFGIVSVGATWTSGLGEDGSEIFTENSLTRTGAVMGTALYMSRERHLGAEADARSDQFAFCVSLYVALYDRWPFEGELGREVVKSIIEGNPRTEDPSSGVPPWVHRVILRGLEGDPADRWESMQALVDRLDSPDRSDVGHRTRAVAALVIGVAFAGLPPLAWETGFPVDSRSYPGLMLMSVLLLAVIGGVHRWGKNSLTATRLNRTTMASVAMTIGMQIPLQLGLWFIDVPTWKARIILLAYWGAMAALFGVAVDRRVLPVAGVYFAAFFASFAAPQLAIWFGAAANAAFFGIIYRLWLRSPRQQPAAT